MSSMFQSTLDRKLFINPALVAAITHMKTEGGYELTFVLSGTDNLRVRSNTEQEMISELNCYKAHCKMMGETNHQLEVNPQMAAYIKKPRADRDLLSDVGGRLATNTGCGSVERDVSAEDPGWEVVGQTVNGQKIWAYLTEDRVPIYCLKAPGMVPLGTGGYYNPEAMCGLRNTQITSLRELK